MRGYLVTFSLALAAATTTLPPAAHASIAGPREEVLRLSLDAYRCGRERGHFDSPFLAVIDYSLPSTRPRMWVIDVRTREIVFEELVAHGRNSGEDMATSFSNVVGSKQSSLGVFRADETYVGRHGYSLRLTGLEPGLNDRARERAIVIHGADYVGGDFVAGHGRLGRSWGCPAVRPAVSRPIIDRLKNGGAVFGYYPDEQWLQTSSFLNCSARLARR